MKRSSTLGALADLRAPRLRVRTGTDARNRAELHLPGGAGPHPVVLALHGGFWRERYSRRYMRPLCALLARHGWAAWNVEYRGVGPRHGGGWPETFEDVARGIDGLARLGEAELGGARLDLDRVVTLGHSAGGHLALWAATRDAATPGGRPRVSVSGVVALAAVSDLEATPDLTAPGGAVRDLMRAGVADAPDDRYALANPRRRLPIGVPLLFVHGEADTTVPVRRSRDFAAAAEGAGDDVTLSTPPELAHRTIVDPRRPQIEVVLAWLEAHQQR